MNEELALKQAINGDIQAFESLFRPFYKALQSYLYRLLADRDEAADLTHDTFIKAFDRIATFRGESSFKTWVFQIGTRLAWDRLKTRKRWTIDVKERAKDICLSTPAVFQAVEQAGLAQGDSAYDIREHISHCFTCMGKTLVIERQVVLILKDVYDFAVKEIALIVGKSPDIVKHLLAEARATLRDIFDSRCALVNKQGVCHQCSELNGWLNPKQDQKQALNQLELVKNADKYDREQLYELRTRLVRGIDPLAGPGAELMNLLHQCDRMAMGERAIPQ